MAGHHLVAQPDQDVFHRELARLARDLGVKDDLEQEVTELFLDRPWIVGLDGLQHFVGFLDEEGLE